MSRQVGVLLFDGFELLDVFGPVELWSRLSDRYEVTFCAVEPGPVRSSQGAAVMATEDMDASAGHDIVLIPGCLLYTSPSPRDKRHCRMPSSA